MTRVSEGLIPERSRFEELRDQELHSWYVPVDLLGLVLNNIEELRSQLPSDEIFGEVYLIESQPPNRLIRYSRSSERLEKTVDVAYGCPECQKIIIGPPEIEIDDPDGNNDNMRGRTMPGARGLYYRCSNCKALLDDELEYHD